MPPDKQTNTCDLSTIARYYGRKLEAHGTNAQGVDWNGEESQRLRFKQLSKRLPDSGEFSVNDLGCGYGALADYLSTHFGPFTYHGYDIAPEMIRAARQRFISMPGIRFEESAIPTVQSDFGIASGIFNVILSNDPLAWQEHITTTLDRLAETSRQGFAFNCLTSYSDPEKMRDHLYYADPCWLFDLCKRRYSGQVALLHDYGLYEFTVLVTKTAP
ncbi:trans-aconitate 2-methyltransferase [Dechloromonas sp.]|uniref:class I SAM-dependent methyltransferase n=1 Tax=Dechloromonas sp. TaxID=1917218 RepID=UPI00216F2987|nr:class I SAM-dependent methyltransferase [Dechloromonas sp.]MBU3698234.1 class I SAM-dependent methyltransferase [Dechloromonas sp.]